ncbi:hypothetical protein DFH06DRAFT_1173391 [Mycena polygramma]|nr:hypothetical protein DFH06DRAFT_1173391 [Mycena polygramma]
MPPSQSLLFLPVFYANLRTDDIPDMDDDLHSYPERQSLGRALSALQGLANLRNIPGGAFLELWPRYWRWHELVIAYMASSSDPEYGEICISFLDFVLRSGHDMDCARLISATTDVRRVFVRGWIYSLGLDDSKMPSSWLPQLLSWMLNHLNPADSSSLEEYLEAAGGSFDDLASLVLRHISRVAPQRKTELAEQPARCFLGLMLFITSADHVNNVEMDLSQSPSQDRPLPLIEALRRLGTPTLTVAACALSGADSPPAPTALANIFWLIALSNRLPRPEICIAESIKRGLLSALVASARPAFSRDVHPQSTVLLGFVLPMSTIHCAVLASVDEALVDVQDIILANHFASTELWPHWQKLVDLVAQRRLLLQRLNSPERLLLKACANMACGRIQEARLFQRCAGCRRVYYCSKPCQTADWRAGGHRDVCNPHSALSINWHYPVSWRDRALLRLLVHQKYESVRWSEIYPQQIEFMHRNPDVAFFTLFTQAWDGFQVGVHAVGSIHDEPFADAEWAAAVTRMKQSAGCMELHVVGIGDGPRTRWWLLPLWVSDARLGEAVAQIVGEIPPGVEDLRLDEAVPGSAQRLIALGEEGGPAAIH